MTLHWTTAMSINASRVSPLLQLFQPTAIYP